MYLYRTNEHTNNENLFCFFTHSFFSGKYTEDNHLLWPLYIIVFRWRSVEGTLVADFFYRILLVYVAKNQNVVKLENVSSLISTQSIYLCINKKQLRTCRLVDFVMHGFPILNSSSKSKLLFSCWIKIIHGSHNVLTCVRLFL